MHFPGIPSLFILAVTFWATPRGAKALVTERNDLVVSMPAAAGVNAQSTNKVGLLLGPHSAQACPIGYALCSAGTNCCPAGDRCCEGGRPPDRSLNSRSMIRILV